MWPVIRSMSKAGFFRMYMRKASDDQWPRACMRDGGVPFSARKVAPLARIDWPLISWLKKEQSLWMKNDLVGMLPF